MKNKNNKYKSGNSPIKTKLLKYLGKMMPRFSPHPTRHFVRRFHEKDAYFSRSLFTLLTIFYSKPKALLIKGSDLISVYIMLTNRKRDTTRMDTYSVAVLVGADWRFAMSRHGNGFPICSFILLMQYITTYIYGIVKYSTDATQTSTCCSFVRLTCLQVPISIHVKCNCQVG
jgi:hypothetical protein